MTEMKIVNTTDLGTLASRAGSGLSGVRLASLDPDGTHVLALMVYGHNMDRPRIPMHHRVRCLAKVRGKDVPAEFMLDVLAEDWNKLLSPSAATLL